MKTQSNTVALTNTTRYNRKKNLVFTLFALPAMALLFVFNYMPMFGLMIAFKDYRYDKGFLGSDWVGFKNFRFFFTSNDAFIVTRNTILYNLAFIVTVLGGAVIFALILNQITRRPLVKFYQTVMFFPYFLSYSVVAYIVLAFLQSDYGVINRLLGLDTNWYLESAIWPPLMVLIHFWKLAGYNAIIIYAALIGIDTSYAEAAAVDGATAFQVIRKITIPLLSPTVIMLALIMIGKIFYSDFGLFYMVPQNSGMIYSVTDVIDTYVYRSLSVLGDVGMSTAIGLYQSVVGLLLVLGANKLTKIYSEESALF